MGRRRRQTGRHDDTLASNVCAISGNVEVARGHDAGLSHVAANAWFLQQSSQGNMNVLDPSVRAQHKLCSGRLDDIVDDEGNNALLLAAAGGHLKLVQALHATGFDLHVVNVHGDNALHLAAFQGHVDVVSWLEQQGVGIHVVEDDPDRLDDEGAIRHLERNLLDLPTSTSTWRHEALCDLFFAFVRRGDIPGIDQFVNNVGRHSFRWHMTDDVGRTALHVAAESNQLAMLQLLLTKPRLSLDAVTRQRDTCLHVAVAEGRLGIVKFLATQCDHAVLHAVNAQRWTALEMACFDGHVDIAMALLETTALSFSCLALAVQGAHVALLQKLLALPDATQFALQVESTSGDSLLHMACAMRHERLCNALLDHYDATTAIADQVTNNWVDVVDCDGCNVVQVVVGLSWLQGVRVLAGNGRLSMDQVAAATTVPFLVQHATADVFTLVYESLSATWQQRVFHAARQSGRVDLVTICSRIHDGHAAAILTNLDYSTTSHRSTPSKYPLEKPVKAAAGGPAGGAFELDKVPIDSVKPSSSSGKLPAEGAERPATSVAKKEEHTACGEALPFKQPGRLAIGELVLHLPEEDLHADVNDAPKHGLPDGVCHGSHSAWGRVLACACASTQAAPAERVHGQQLRQLLAHANGHRLLHYVDEVVELAAGASATTQPQNGPTSRHFILYEHATTTWRQAFHMTPLDLKNCDGLAVVRDAVAALACLHAHDRVHGSVTVENLWLVGCDGPPWSTKLLCRGSEWVDKKRLRCQEVFAQDVLALGQCIAYALRGHDDSGVGQAQERRLSQSASSAEALDLLEVMTDVDPLRRPTIDGVQRHPFLWTRPQKLAYIEAVANHAYVELQQRQHAMSLADDWGAALEVRGLDVHRRRQYDTSSVVDLVRWIRNLKQHAAELSRSTWRLLRNPTDELDEIELSVGDQQRVLEDFVLETFPDLVLRLWRCLGPLESFRGRPAD